MFDSRDLSIILKAKDEASKVIQGASANIKSSMGTALSAAKTAAVGIAAVGVAVAAAAGKSISAAADFETMNVALKTAFQGNEQAAKDAAQQITQFAAKTPYELEEVMRGFVKLKNMGLDPSQKALTAYGDTASAMGKSLNDMVEAVADAATGEFERLKEFGIRASSEGDKVTFTFQGVSTTVGKNSKEIEDYLIKLGQTKFAGGMEAQSKTLSGQLSTLKDNFNIAAAEFANSTGLFDLAKNAISGASDAVQDISKKAIGLYDVLVKGDFNKSFTEAFQVQEDSQLVDFLFDVREGLIKAWEAISQTGRAVAEQLWPHLERLWKTIGEQLIPSLQNFWKEMGPILMPILIALGKIIGGTIILALKLFIDNLTLTAQFAAKLADGIVWAKDRIIEAFNWIKERVMWLKDNFWEAVGFIIGFFATLPIKLPFFVFNAISAIIGYLASINWGNVFASIGHAFGSVWESVKSAAKNAWNYITNLNWGAIVGGIGRGIGNAVIGLIEGAINGAISGIPGMKGFKLPRFDAGGVVPGPIGSPQLVLAHGGETILPTHKQPMAAGQTIINVYAEIRDDFDAITLGQKLDWAMKNTGRL